jgi:hypothetical protein
MRDNSYTIARQKSLPELFGYGMALSVGGDHPLNGVTPKRQSLSPTQVLMQAKASRK